MRSYYDILEVRDDATEQEIKKAYTRLVKKLHPDRTKNEEDKRRFLDVQQAYEVLSDKSKRQHYDTSRKSIPNFNHKDYAENSSRYGSASNGDYEQYASSFEDLFSGFFGRDFFSGASSFPNEAFQYNDCEAKVHMNFFEGSIGAKKSVSYVKQSLCSCAERKPREREKYCGKCKNGWYYENTTLEISFPGALPEKTMFTVEGAGNVYGKRKSNLNIIVYSPLSFKEWRREGVDVYKNVFVSYEMHKGGKIVVENIYNRSENVFIPEGLQSGDTIVVNKAGVSANGRVGDFILTILFYVPDNKHTFPRESKTFRVNKK